MSCDCLVWEGRATVGLLLLEELSWTKFPSVVNRILSSEPFKQVDVFQLESLIWQSTQLGKRCGKEGSPVTVKKKSNIIWQPPPADSWCLTAACLIKSMIQVQRAVYVICFPTSVGKWNSTFRLSLIVTMHPQFSYNGLLRIDRIYTDKDVINCLLHPQVNSASACLGICNSWCIKFHCFDLNCREPRTHAY